MRLEFADFQIDLRTLELRHGGEPVSVEPQVFEVLSLLIRQRHRVVTREELLDEVWGDRFVSDSTVSHRVMEARRALGDDGRAQRFIRTVHGRGFHFHAEVREVQALSSVAPSATLAPLGGRDEELLHLMGCLEEARRGRGRCVLLRGEAGLGKTTLVRAFLSAVGLWSAIGNCLGHGGRPEPFLPILDALYRLCTGERGEQVIARLNRHAPGWLAQMPGLLEPAAQRELQSRTVGVSRERMLREIGEALQALAEDGPLILVLEDLHWSDPSTLDLLCWMARREGPSNLLLLGTFRPAEDCSRLRELALRGQAVELTLSPLGPEAALAMLVERGCQNSQALVEAFLQRTGGNPLFMRLLLEHWQARGVLGSVVVGDLERDVPPSVRDLIERQLAGLSRPERAVLEAASTLGAEFAAAEVAAAAEMSEEAGEEVCHTLSIREAFLKTSGEEVWPDGTVTSRFAFLHDLYREVLYRWLPAGRRARMHGRVAERLEAAWHSQVEHRAADLAYHFENSCAPQRAVPYLATAARLAMRRNAPLESDGLLSAGLELLGRLPAGPERDFQELELRLLRASARIAHHDWSDPGAEACLLRCLDLGQQKGAERELSKALYGLAGLYEMRGEYGRCQELLEARLDMGEADVDSQELMACSYFHQGAFRKALEHAERGLELYDPASHRDLPMAAYGDNAAVSCHAWAALSLTILGQPEEGLARAEHAVSIAGAEDHRFSLPLALLQSAIVHQLREEPEKVLEFARRAIEAACQQGFSHHRAGAEVLEGWAVSRLGDAERGLAILDQGLRSYRLTGARIELPYFLLLRARCAIDAGLLEEARTSLEEAGAFSEGGRGLNVAAEILRLRGELAQNPALTRAALETARSQQAELFERKLAEMRGCYGLDTIGGRPPGKQNGKGQARRPAPAGPERSGRELSFKPRR